MSAQRKLIRRAAAAHLMNRTPAGARVFSSRAAPMWDHDESELPAICVYCGNENISIFQEAPRMYKRELDLKIEIGVSGADADDQLDDIGDAVERLIGRSNRLTYARDQTVAEIVLASEQIEFSGEGKKTIGALVIVYTATYYTPEPDELDSEPIDDLRRVRTEYDLDGRQTVPDRAADEVEFP